MVSAARLGFKPNRGTGRIQAVKGGLVTAKNKNKKIGSKLRPQIQSRLSGGTVGKVGGKGGKAKFVLANSVGNKGKILIRTNKPSPNTRSVPQNAKGQTNVTRAFLQKQQLPAKKQVVTTKLKATQNAPQNNFVQTRQNRQNTFAQRKQNQGQNTFVQGKQQNQRQNTFVQGKQQNQRQNTFAQGNQLNQQQNTFVQGKQQNQRQSRRQQNAINRGNSYPDQMQQNENFAPAGNLYKQPQQISNQRPQTRNQPQQNNETKLALDIINILLEDKKNSSNGQGQGQGQSQSRQPQRQNKQRRPPMNWNNQPMYQQAPEPVYVQQQAPPPIYVQKAPKTVYVDQDGYAAAPPRRMVRQRPMVVRQAPVQMVRSAPRMMQRATVQRRLY